MRGASPRLYIPLKCYHPHSTANINRYLFLTASYQTMLASPDMLLRDRGAIVAETLGNCSHLRSFLLHCLDTVIRRAWLDPQR